MQDMLVKPLFFSLIYLFLSSTYGYAPRIKKPRFSRGPDGASQAGIAGFRDCG